MTIEEMILEEIDKIPLKKQTELQQKYTELHKEKEHYRYELIAQERLTEQWKRNYEKLDNKRNKAIDYIRELLQNSPDEIALYKILDILRRKKQ